MKFLVSLERYFLRFSAFNLCRAYRTPLCKSKRGGFKDTYPDDLLAPVLRVRLNLPCVSVFFCSDEA